MLLLLALPTLAVTPAETAAVAAALESDDGWTIAGEVELDTIGPVQIKHKVVSGYDCLEGNTLTEAPIPTLALLARDIPANMRWTSADLIESEYLSPDGATASSFDYYQYLNNPTPIKDRYWYLRATISQQGDVHRFTWEHIDPEVAWSEHHARVLSEHSGAVMTAMNVGSWRFTPESGQTRISYRLCTEAGGMIPRWAGELAARTTLPNNLRDIIQEARRLQ